MVRVLVCSDKFKGTATAQQINTAIATALAALLPNKVTARQLNLSDGGDGFLDGLTKALSLKQVNVTVTGPLGELIEAAYGIRGDTAVVEMARASGLELMDPSKLNPMETTTKGAGELILAAYQAGCRHLLLGIGGSATNDGGLGALQALGVDVIGSKGPITGPICGKHLSEIKELKYRTGNKTLVPDLQVDIACDVTNPFVGPRGAVAVFSKQKGATPQMQEELERGMHNAAHHLRSLSGCDVTNLPGAGAAGGMGGGFAAVLGARLLKGMDVLGQAVGLESAVRESDLVVTGEGCYDAQTAEGKVVSYVQDLCDRHRVPCVVVCGVSELEPSNHVYDLVSRYGKDKALKDTVHCVRQLVEQTASQWPRLNE